MGAAWRGPSQVSAQLMCLTGISGLSLLCHQRICSVLCPHTASGFPERSTAQLLSGLLLESLSRPLQYVSVQGYCISA